MTNKEFFLKKLEEEARVFARVFAAVPSDHQDYKPDPKSKTAVQIAATIASEISGLAVVVKEGTRDASKGGEKLPAAMPEIIAMFEEGMRSLTAAVTAASDDEWEGKEVKMIFPVGEWKARMYDMCWGLIFDVVHHRGQLSTYLRAMGGKVPSIYGPSADSVPAM